MCTSHASIIKNRISCLFSLYILTGRPLIHLCFSPTDIPKAPGRILPTRNTDTSVVVTWTEPPDAKELVGYYIESSVEGSGRWEPCNNNPVKGTR